MGSIFSVWFDWQSFDHMEKRNTLITQRQLLAFVILILTAFRFKPSH